MARRLNRVRQLIEQHVTGPIMVDAKATVTVRESTVEDGSHGDYEVQYTFDDGTVIQSDGTWSHTPESGWEAEPWEWNTITWGDYDDDDIEDWMTDSEDYDDLKHVVPAARGAL